MELGTGASELFKCAKELFFTLPGGGRACGGALGTCIKKLRAREVALGFTSAKTSRRFTFKKSEKSR